MNEIDTRVSTEVMGWEHLTIGYWDSDDETPRQKELEMWLHGLFVEGKWTGMMGDYYINVAANMFVPVDDFRPSTDIRAAWMVVMALTSDDGPHADLKWSFGLEYSSVIDWVADFTPRRNHPKAREYPAFQGGGRAAPEAICRAALRAVGKDTP